MAQVLDKKNQKGNVLRNNSWSEAPESEDEDENSLLNDTRPKLR